ncbi:hypothetical protein ACF0H5_016305 [Mactra antiquata]
MLFNAVWTYFDPNSIKKFTSKRQGASIAETVKLIENVFTSSRKRNFLSFYITLE